jgi:transposase
MISEEQVARIRHLFHAEHRKIGTIAAELGLHPDTVRAALDTDRFRSRPRLRDRLTDPYLDFLRQTLQRYPRLRATRLFEMIRPRGYTGSLSQLRRVVAEIRPPRHEAFLRLRTFPGEQAQADWASFSEVSVGRARRRLSAFVLTLAYSRALWLEFFFDQTLENFLLGHVHAFHNWGGAPRRVTTDNLRSVVLERRGDAFHFRPRWLELSAHYHFATHPCRPARGNEKGRVERTIQYVRHRFFAARPSYDRHQLIEDPAHREALLEQKRKALGSTPSGRLAALAPESQTFLQAAFERGESAARLTAQLLRLLDDYGPAELAAALREALDHDTPRASSVAFILARRHRQRQRRSLLSVDLSRRPDLEHLTVSTPCLEAYDELSQDPEEPEPEP